MTKHTTYPAMNNRPQQMTPLQQLIADKRSLRRRLREEEQELDEGWQLVRDNAGRLILTGLSRLFFPRRKNTSSASSQENRAGFWQNITDNLPYYLNMTREGLSIAWLFIKPLYKRWQTHHNKREE